MTGGAPPDSLEEVLGAWLARHGGDSLLDARTERGPLSLPGIHVTTEMSSVRRSDWALIDACDEGALAEAARHATRGVVCVLPNERCLTAPSSWRTTSSLREAAPALWRIGRVRETAWLNRPSAARGFPLLRRLFDERLARSRAFLVDVAPRASGSKRRTLVKGAR